MFCPKISIITPVYNAEKFLKQTIESALSQSWRNIEVIAVNDGSTDESFNILNSFTDPRLKIFTKPNGGASRAKQFGIDQASGDYIQYLDADDILHPRKIEIQLEQLRDKEDHVCFCKTAHFFSGDSPFVKNMPDSDDYVTEFNDAPSKFLINLYGGYDGIGGMIQPNAFLIPRAIVRSAGPWNTDISPCQDEDGEYFCRIILAAKGIIYEPSILNYYRKFRNQQSLSSLKSERNYLNLINSVCLKHSHVKANILEPEDKIAVDYFAYKDLSNIMVKCFPGFMKSYHVARNKRNNYYNKGFSLPKIVFGGVAINFAGRVNWKLARYLQFIAQKLK